MVRSFILFVLLFILSSLQAQKVQDAGVLIKTVREKLEKVSDYQADASLKTDIPFLRMPDAAVKVYYKKPDRMKIRNEKGISLVPRQTASISLYSLLTKPYQVIDGGRGIIGGTAVRVVKLLPENANDVLVLATLYIDPVRLLVLKSLISTRENGTDEVDLTYGKYADLALPDLVVFSFNTREFKLPKGVTFDYDDGSAKKAPDSTKNERGRIEIKFLKYVVNGGLKDAVFE